MASPETVRAGAVAGVLVHAPGRGTHDGAQVEYLGRRTDHAAIKANSVKRPDGIVVLKNLELCYPIDAEHNTTYHRSQGISVTGAVRNAIRLGEAVPLDQATADWAGVPFVEAPKTTKAAPTRGAGSSPSDAKDS
jgi:hypothetical protein